MNRFDRITAILIQLQSRRVVRAQDLADRFSVSLRTVYRDINSLSEAGVPIAGEAGVGYSIMDGYRLPPVMFTKEEARTFLAAEKLMEKFTDFSMQSQYQSAMYKVKAVLKTTEKEMMENLENHIEIRRDFLAPRHAPDNVLDVLLKSISEKKAVKIDYKTLAAEAESTRVIEPVGIYHENSHWYTVAFCHLRNSYRNFRSDRIRKIELTQQTFNLQHAPLKDFLKRHVYDDKNLELVEIKIEKRAAPYIQEQRYYYGFVSETIEPEHVVMTFLSGNIEGFARWFLMIAPNAIVIRPESLKQRLLRLAQGVIEKLS